MTVLAIGSVHGSPGATTLALDLARSAGPDTLLIEADPDGGCLAARLDLAIRPGLTELAGAARTGIAAADLCRFAQLLDPGIAVVVAHPAAEQVHAALRTAVHHVGTAIGSLTSDVVIDIGRLRPGSPALGFAAMADHTLVLVGNAVESVVTLHHRRHLLAGLGMVSVVLDAAAPHQPDEVAMATGQTVWGVVPPGGRPAAMRRRLRAIAQLIADTSTQPDVAKVTV